MHESIDVLVTEAILRAVKELKEEVRSFVLLLHKRRLRLRFFGCSIAEAQLFPSSSYNRSAHETNQPDLRPQQVVQRSTSNNSFS